MKEEKILRNPLYHNSFPLKHQSNPGKQQDFNLVESVHAILLQRMW